jgi:hypothetical protein
MKIRGSRTIMRCKNAGGGYIKKRIYKEIIVWELND